MITSWWSFMMHSTPQTIFTPFLVVQFHAFHRSVPGFVAVVSATFGCLLVVASVLLVDMSPHESTHGADCELLHLQFAWVSFFQFSCLVAPWRRCVGKQPPTAPEVQLRDVVGSDESFFRLREQPNHQNTRICGANADLSCSQLP